MWYSSDGDTSNSLLAAAPVTAFLWLLGRYSAVVDGSLQDWRWHSALFERIRREFPRYSLGILHVTAHPDTVHARAAKRARATGRIVPEAVLDKAMARVPEAVERLAPQVDYLIEVDNTGSKPQLLRLSGGGVAATQSPLLRCLTMAWQQPGARL